MLSLLKHKSAFGRRKVIPKEKWISVRKASGFSEADIHRWHAEFERSAPEQHQEFLAFLHISSEEIRLPREWTRKAQRA